MVGTRLSGDTKIAAEECRTKLGHHLLHSVGIIAEAFPAAEANEILKKYAEAYAQGMNIVNLNLIQDLGK